MGRPMAAALLAVSVVLTGLATVLPLYSAGYDNNVEMIVRGWGTTIVNKPGDWPAGELSPMYAIPLVVTALALAVGVFHRQVARGGAAAQVGAVGVLIALAVAESGRDGRFSVGIGLVLLVVATITAVLGAFRQ